MKMKSTSSPSQHSRTRSLTSSRPGRKPPAAPAVLFLGTKVIGELRTLMRLAAPVRREMPEVNSESFRSF